MQNKEFHERRRKGIGGSDIAVVMGLSPYKTPLQLYREKIGEVDPEDISALPHILRGTTSEKVARMLLEQQHSVSYVPRSWVGQKDYYRCSDDGYSIDTETILEIKAMGEEAHKLVGSMNTVPEHYLLQCQWNFMVSKAKHCLFVSFRPEDESMYTVKLDHDLALQERMRHAADDFWWGHVYAKQPPAPTDRDYVEIKDERLEGLLKSYTSTGATIKHFEEAKEKLMDEIKPYFDKHSHLKTPSGFTLSKSQRRGAVDTAKIATEFGINLDGYRKAPSEVYQVRMPKIKLP